MIEFFRDHGIIAGLIVAITGGISAIGTNIATAFGFQRQLSTLRHEIEYIREHAVTEDACDKRFDLIEEIRASQDSLSEQVSDLSQAIYRHIGEPK